MDLPGRLGALISAIGADIKAAALKVEAVNTVAAAGSTETLADPATGPSINRITLDSTTCAISAPTAAAGKSLTLVLIQDGTGGRLATWASNIKWPGGVTPVLTTTAGRRDVFTLFCHDGTNYDAFFSGANFS